MCRGPPQLIIGWPFHRQGLGRRAIFAAYPKLRRIQRARRWLLRVSYRMQMRHRGRSKNINLSFPFIMASPVRVERFTIFPNPIPSSQYANRPRQYTAPVIMALLYRNHISIAVDGASRMALHVGRDGGVGDTAPQGAPHAF